MKYLLVSLILAALGLGFLFLSDSTCEPTPMVKEIPVKNQDKEGLDVFYDTYIMPSTYDTHDAILELEKQQKER